MNGTTQRFGQGLLRAVLWAWVALAMVPLIWMVTTSLKPEGLAQSIPPTWVFAPTLQHYRDALGGAQVTPFAPLLLHSAIVAVLATIVSLVLGLLAAYALARVRFAGKRQLAMWILSTLMFPPVVSVIPIFILAGRLDIIDRYPTLVIPYAAFNLPLVIWTLRSSIRQIPEEIEDAALVDGASRYEIIFRIVLPLAGPGIATAAILSMLLSWNEFLFALTLTRSLVKTAPVGINEFTGMFGTQWGSMSAAATTIVAPVVLMALLLRRHLIEGLTLGAVK
ncbi:MAG: carbohydrate ABC transporter permease [Chloroflexia bacterium]|nr:carbohydrate ABC transporter permease [Chloroflexia bacterium]